MKRLLPLLILLLPACSKNGQDVKPEPEPTPVTETVYDSIDGLVLAGYQGWFTANGDNSPRGKAFYHYQESGTFEPGPRKNSIDFWPDVSEYTKTYETPFKMPDGSPARVYSAWDESSVLLHFKWMYEYGIDGVFVQRFVSEVVKNSTGKQHFDKVLQSAMKASNHYRRAIAVAYDLSGGLGYGGRTVQMVLEDAAAIKDRYSLADRSAQKYYIYENGKPLVCVWGAGFSDGRAYSIADVSSLVDGLHELGFSVILGVPAYWRELFADAVPDAALHTLIKKCEAVFPWTVNRFNSSGADSYKFTMRQDIAWCKDAGVKYAACLFPGFSWENMQPSGNSTVSREGGKFLWHQGFNAISEGAGTMYVAMFDEMDEGTAIFKTLNASKVPSDAPVSDYYVCWNGSSFSISDTFKEPASGGWCKPAASLGVKFQGIEDNLPTDHYLWLTGKLAEMLRGKLALTDNIPGR